MPKNIIAPLYPTLSSLQFATTEHDIDGPSPMAISLSFSPYPIPKLQNTNAISTSSSNLSSSSLKIPPCNNTSRREFILKTATASLFVVTAYPFAQCLAEPLPGIANTKSWVQFYGDGFAIRVPPQFEDIMEPEDFNAGLSLYGDKAKPKTFAARFASPDGSEVVSVVIRPSNQLKITFLEAQDITDLGSLKEAAKIFVPGGATLYSARTFKIKEDDGYRTYYFYEFSRDEQHIALVAAVNSGKLQAAFEETRDEKKDLFAASVVNLFFCLPFCKTIIAGASAPQSKWDDDGVRLRSAAISLTVL